MSARMPRMRGADRQHRSDGKDGGASHPRSDWHPAHRVGQSQRGRVAMTSLSDRLRGVISNNLVRTPESVRRPGPLDPAIADAAGEVLGGEWCESSDGRFLVIDRSYSPGHRHGSMSIADGLPPSDGYWPRLSLLAD